MTSGLCTCDEEHQGYDCSGKLIILLVIKHDVIKYIIIFSLELICPGDCSNAGNCDTSTGICLCDPGRNGPDCSSKLLFALHFCFQTAPILNPTQLWGAFNFENTMQCFVNTLWDVFWDVSWDIFLGCFLGCFLNVL